MLTFTWIYLWFFVFMQSLTIFLAIAALKARNTPLVNRVAFSATALLRAAVSILLGLYLLTVLEAETLDPLWIMLIVALFGIVELFVKRVTEKHLLKIPQPTFREFFT